MKEIQLTQGKVAWIDDEDFYLVSETGWTAICKGHKRTLWYAVTWNNGRAFEMHRLIMGFPEGREVDHRNGNGLDNRRENLRIATTAQNQANQRKSCGVSRFKGVDLNRKAHTWRARIMQGQKSLHLGMFKTEEAAARAYDRAATELWGEFAWLNFP